MANAATKTSASQKTTNDGYKLSLQVSKKGAVQLNGLRRFPVTLYQDEWEAIFTRQDKIREFISKNKKDLKSKEEAGDNDGEREAI